VKRTLILILLSLTTLPLTFGQTKSNAESATSRQELEEACKAPNASDSKLADVCRTLQLEKQKAQQQDTENMQFWSAKYCGAKWAPDSAERVQWVRVKTKMMPTLTRQYHVPITFLIVDSPVINSWTIPGDKVNFICMPTKMIDFLSSDGQIAFVMGHEIGHAVDPICKHINRNDLAARRACESRADAVGFDLLFKSGYSPFDVGAAFGKLEMYSGDINTDKNARQAALSKDHPMTPDRIAHMRQMLGQYNAVISGPLARQAGQ
jgi:predicted Zn-dependent protease